MPGTDGDREARRRRSEAAAGEGTSGGPGNRQRRYPEEERVQAASWSLERGSEMLLLETDDIALKYIRPDECVKYMRVCVDPAILEDASAFVLLDVLNTLESEYSVEAQSVPSTITWRRELPAVTLSDLPAETKNMYKSKEENQVLVLLSPNHFLRMVWSHKQKMKGIFTENICETFDSFIMRVLDKQSHRAATLAVIGLDTYTREKGLYSPVKRPKNSENDQVEDSESWVSRELGLTCADLDEVQVALQLQTHTTIWFLENWQQFADHIATLTKAIARSPFKLIDNAAQSGRSRIFYQRSKCTQQENVSIEELDQTYHADAARPEFLLQFVFEEANGLIHKVSLKKEVARKVERILEMC
ncbi:probable crossover junction endonuclease EME2 isoform X4 [Stegostoma tigrinum]|uniref:probable crossover junction endonuclease EME2 isoform X4 n=1 Tax=Stegostoma tigrinum TaxID=3053191 RepID=UPI0028705D48|nr:probable crossover junction endonuclease EME2 isoform X4 [Stegostoma tigrinum]